VTLVRDGLMAVPGGLALAVAPGVPAVAPAWVMTVTQDAALRAEAV